jgi:hypothetical protein
MHYANDEIPDDDVPTFGPIQFFHAVVGLLLDPDMDENSFNDGVNDLMDKAVESDPTNRITKPALMMIAGFTITNTAIALAAHGLLPESEFTTEAREVYEEAMADVQRIARERAAKERDLLRSEGVKLDTPEADDDYWNAA